MNKLNLPIWLNGPRVKQLKTLFEQWWQMVEAWLYLPLTQMNVDTCSLTILDLIAWQRDISRFSGEPEWLYRARVKYAFVNAVDAGSTAGFARIFQRLGVGFVEILERQPGKDWDVIVLNVSDGDLAKNQSLLNLLIQMYGRTCRRYEWTVLTPVILTVRLSDFNEDQQTLVATL